MDDLENDRLLENGADETVRTVHMDNTLNLLLYTILLIFTVLTIFVIKKRSYSFVNETGLILIYGLLVGLIMKLVGGASGKCSALDVVAINEDYEIFESYPDFLRLTKNSTSSNSSEIFEYHFDSIVNQDTFFEEKGTFDSEIFFGIILPPIIFNAGYSLKKRNFFRNIGTILTFSVFGTTISCIIIGFIMYGISLLSNLSFLLSDLLLFGAMISATDPVSVLAIFNELNVDVDLFAILFGESAMNDAVAIVLSGTIEQFGSGSLNGSVVIGFSSIMKSVGLFFGIFLCSLAFGIVAGWVAALVTKFTKISDYPLLETSFIILTSYLSFLLAEVVGMTGVVALLFCGICQAHYTYNNLSNESKAMTKEFFEILSFFCVSFIFGYIGVSMFTSSAHYFNLWFILGSFMAIFIARAFFIYILSAILNLRRSPKIPLNYQHMLFFSGLRGAVAFALTVRNTSTHHRRMMYSTTSLIVIFTVLVNGSLTKKMIQWLQLKFNNDQEVEMQSDRFENSSVCLDDENCDENSNVCQHNPWDKAFLPRQWYNLDAKFFKPLLTNCQPNLMETMPKCFLKVATLLTSKHQMNEHFRHPRNILGDVDDGLGDDMSNASDETQPHFGPLRLNSGTL